MRWRLVRVINLNILEFDMTTYGYYAPVTIEVDLTGANGANGLSNMTALIKVNSD